MEIQDATGKNRDGKAHEHTGYMPTLSQKMIYSVHLARRIIGRIQQGLIAIIRKFPFFP
jgi:hypothetical protein